MMTASEAVVAASAFAAVPGAAALAGVVPGGVAGSFPGCCMSGVVHFQGLIFADSGFQMSTAAPYWKAYVLFAGIRFFRCFPYSRGFGEKFLIAALFPVPYVADAVQHFYL